MYWDDGDERAPTVEAFTPTATRGDVFHSALDDELYNNTLIGERMARRDAYDALNKHYEELTGEKLDNPYRVEPDMDAVLYGKGDYIGFAEDRWEKKRKALRKKFPQYDAELSRSVDDKAVGVAKTLRRKANEDYANAPEGVWTGLSMAGGAGAGFLGDPVNALATLTTAGVGNIGFVGAKMMAQNAIKVGIVNSAVEGMTLPGISQWRSKTGDPMSDREGSLRLLMAFGAGFGLDFLGRGAVRGVAKAVGREAVTDPFGLTVQGYRRRGTGEAEVERDVRGLDRIAAGMSQSDPVMARAISPDATGREVAAGIRRSGLDNDEDFKSLAETLEARDAMEVEARQGLEDVPEPEIAKRIDDAAKHFENADAHAPPGSVDAVPPAKKGDLNFRDNTGGADAPAGKTLKVRGKPVHTEDQDLTKLVFDRESFQFKGGTDARGVSDRMSGVQEWDDFASGKVYVYEREDGTRVIADGHQRTALAQRLAAEGKDVSDTRAFVFKEAEGWSPGEVRALAAKKNLQEGTGSAVDAAKVMREEPGLIDKSVPLSGPTMRTARSLTRLSDEAFDMVAAGVVKPSHAAVVGDILASQPGRHEAMLKGLLDAEPRNVDEASFIVNKMAAAPDHEAVQLTLLGAETVNVNTFRDMAEFAGKVEKKLLQDERVFGMLSREVNRIEAAGNRLDKAVNKTKAVEAAQARELVKTLATSRGRVSEMLDEAVAEWKATGKIEKPMADFIERFRTILDEEGLTGLNKKTNVLDSHPKIDELGEAEAQKMFDDSMDDMFPEGRPGAEPAAKAAAAKTGKAVKKVQTPEQAKKEKELAVRKQEEATVAALKKRNIQTEELDEALKIEKHLDVINECKLI